MYLLASEQEQIEVSLLQKKLEHQRATIPEGSKDDYQISMVSKKDRVNETDVASTIWDPELLNRSCLGAWMNETKTNLDQVCSDDESNNIKSDKGNYIQYTRREDRLMYKAWSGAFQDCIMGQTYVRDIVASFAERTSCFANETALIDEDDMYIPVKELVDGKSVVTEERDKVICPGDKHMPNQTMLNEKLALLRNLVAQWDDNLLERNATDGSLHSVEGERESICREMLSAHTLHKYNFVGVLHSTRPAACNRTGFYDRQLCDAAEKYLRDFQSRDLFVRTGGGFKGRAAEGENARSERCKDEMLQGRAWNEMLSTKPGITVEIPDCSIKTDTEVFPEPILKVGVWHEDQANNIIADAYRQCSAPLVAGISATLPQYLASAAAGPQKHGKNFSDSLEMKEVLSVMSMLELGGFHAVTGLTLGVNFYFKELVVTPPFDSGAFDGPDNGIIRCHDAETNCCTNATKVDGYYNNKVYLQMMQNWESKVDELWSSSLRAQPLTAIVISCIWLALSGLSVVASASSL
jgi:hypothetical protein